MTVRVDALSAVNHEWARAGEVHKRSGNYTARSFRDALVNLSQEGAIEQRSVPYRNGGQIYEYRLPQKVDA